MIEDRSAREALRQVARQYHRELVADRGMDTEAQVLEIIQEMRDSRFATLLSIREIASRFVEQHGQDYQRKITPHWIGHVIRRKLGLKTERHRDGYGIAASENPKLDRLFEKYGIAVAGPDGSVNLVNSVNSPQGLEDGGML